MQKTTKILFSIFLPLSIILLSIQSVIFDTDLFIKKSIDYGSTKTLEEARVKDQINNLVLYLKNKEDLKNNYYSIKEQTHLEDVKNIINYTTYLTYLSLIILVVTYSELKKKINKIDFIKLIRNINLHSSYILVIFLLIIYFSFNKSFIFFHQVLFKNDYWLLNPDHEFLVVIFPEIFFRDIFQLIIAKVILTMIVIIITTALLIRLEKTKKI